MRSAGAAGAVAPIKVLPRAAGTRNHTHLPVPWFSQSILHPELEDAERHLSRVGQVCRIMISLLLREPGIARSNMFPCPYCISVISGKAEMKTFVKRVSRSVSLSGKAILATFSKLKKVLEIAFLRCPDFGDRFLVLSPALEQRFRLSHSSNRKSEPLL